MDQSTLTELISRTAMLMEQFERNCFDIERRQQALSQDLQELAQQLPATVRQSADASLQTLPGQVLGKVHSGLDRSMGDYEKRLQAAGTQLADGSLALARQLQHMERLHRHLIWKTTAAVAGCLSLLLIGGIWLSTHYAGVIGDNKIAADKLEAINRADLTLCGGRLCANIDLQGERYGDRGQYQPVKSR